MTLFARALDVGEERTTAASAGEPVCIRREKLIHVLCLAFVCHDNVVYDAFPLVPFLLKCSNVNQSIILTCRHTHVPIFANFAYLEDFALFLDSLAS